MSSSDCHPCLSSLMPFQSLFRFTLKHNEPFSEPLISLTVKFLLLLFLEHYRKAFARFTVCHHQVLVPLLQEVFLAFHPAWVVGTPWLPWYSKMSSAAALMTEHYNAPLHLSFFLSVCLSLTHTPPSEYKVFTARDSASFCILIPYQWWRIH
jgi:hypothetical protein